MKLMIIAVFSLTFVLGQTTTKIGNTYWHSNGTSSTKIGGTTWNSDGSSSTKTGNTYWHNSTQNSTTDIYGNKKNKKKSTNYFGW